MSDSGQSARLHAQSLQLRPTLCSPIYCGLPDSSVHGILQARILEWVATPLQGIFLIQGWNPCLYLSCFLYWQVGSLPLVTPGKPSD